MSSVLTFF